MHERSGRNSRPQSERRNSYFTRAKRTTKRLVAGMLLLLAQLARQDGRWQDKRYGQKLDGPSIPARTLVEYIAITAEDTSRLHQFGKKTLKRTITILGYVLRVVRRWVKRLDDDRLWRINSAKRQEVFLKGEFEFPCANENQRIPPRRRQPLIPHGNLEREDDVEIEEDDNEGRNTEVSWTKNGKLIYRHHENFLWSFTTLIMQIPDPIRIRRRNETNSDEHKQCLCTHYQWFVARSEWCHSLWEVDWDHKIPLLTYKTSWRIQVGEWKTHEDPKGYQTRQRVAWSMDRVSKKQENYTAECVEESAQIWGVDRCEGFLQAQCWRSCETGNRYRSRFTVHWEGWQPRATAGGCNFSWCQWEPTTSEHTEHAGENEATTNEPHRRNGTCGKSSRSFGTQASFCSRSYDDARSHSRNGKIRNINSDAANMGCKESATEVTRNYPSGEGRWKNIAFFRIWWTLVTWRTPSLQNTSRTTQVASCALGWQRQRRRRIQSSTLRGTSFNASWCDWRNTWRNFSVHSSQNDRSSQIVTLSIKMEQSLWLKVAKFVKLHQSNEELQTTTL